MGFLKLEPPMEGYGVNHLDIAPRAAGVIVGISNTWGSVAGACAPVVMGWLTPFPLGRSRESFDDGSTSKRLTCVFGCLDVVTN